MVVEWSFRYLLLTTIVFVHFGCGSDSNQHQSPNGISNAEAQGVVSGSGGTGEEESPAAPSAGTDNTYSGSGIGGSGGSAEPQDRAGEASEPREESGASGSKANDGGTISQGVTEGDDIADNDSGTVSYDAGMTQSSGPTLPEISDPAVAGPFRVETVATANGLPTHTLFVPDNVGTNGKHPTVIWTCGHYTTTAMYASFLDHIASHGFLVVADKESPADREAEVVSQESAVEWLIAENSRQGGEFFEKIDLDNIGVMGHSLGSLASFATAAKNEYIATSIHFSGGLTDNPVGFDDTWLASMTKPAAFLCGGADTQAGPSCTKDFEQAPADLPVFYGVLAGANHIGPFLGVPRGGEYGRAGVAWLRWQLADDPTFEGWFVGPNCTLCTTPWTAQQRNLN